MSLAHCHEMNGKERFCRQAWKHKRAKTGEQPFVLAGRSPHQHLCYFNSPLDTQKLNKAPQQQSF